MKIERWILVDLRCRWSVLYALYTVLLVKKLHVYLPIDQQTAHYLNYHVEFAQIAGLETVYVCNVRVGDEPGAQAPKRTMITYDNGGEWSVGANA
jgi:hypothetical protein